MPNFQTDLIFEEHGSRGWIESFFDEQDSAAEGSLFTVAEVNRIMRPRNSGVRLKAIRCTEVGGLRRSHIRPYNASNPSAGIGYLADVAGVSVKYRLGFESFGGRTLEMRGIPDFAVTRDLQGNDVLSEVIRPAINDYMALIRDNFRGQQKTPADILPWVPVVSLAKHAGNDQWTVVKHKPNATLNLGAGSEIYFRHLDKDVFPYIRGVFAVREVSSDTEFAIGVRWREATDEVALRNVDLRRVIYQYPRITSTDFLKLGTRDTGGPSSRPRGRRPGRELRR